LTTPRIYLPQEADVGRLLELEEDHVRYIRTVLRLRNGDPLILFGGGRFEYSAVVRDVTAAGVSVEVIEKKAVPGSDIRINLAQALPKGPKMDFIIQKATELGVNRIIPFHSTRSVPRLSADKAHLKIARWQKIAVEASRQCRRSDVPEVADIRSFDQTLGLAGDTALKLIFWEEESGRGIKGVLRDPAYSEARDFFLVIGPEGGFAREEVDRAVRQGYLSVGLGPQVLKLETASLAILAVIQYERGILGNHSESEQAR